jgi:hypothetical protein
MQVHLPQQVLHHFHQCARRSHGGMTVLDLVLKEVLVGVNKYTRQRSHHTKLVVVAMKAGWDLKYAKAGAEQLSFMES